MANSGANTNGEMMLSHWEWIRLLSALMPWLINCTSYGASRQLSVFNGKTTAFNLQFLIQSY
jgi:hypothetical protein